MSVSQKQTVEIVKVLYRGANILILDEPTAVLTPQETDKLFAVMRNMKNDGKSLIIITHKLHEVLDVSDRVAVLRKGEYIGCVQTKDANQQSLTDMMVGHAVTLNIDRPTPVNVKPRLDIKGLTVFDEMGVKRLDNVTFTANAGEVLGIAGIAGSGQRELLESIAGLYPVASGSVTYYNPDNDQPKELVGLSPMAIRKSGIAMSFVPEDRLGMGLVGSMGMTGNMMLRSWRKGQVHAVAFGADTAVSAAGQHGADLGGVDVEGFQQRRVALGHHVILGDQHLVGAGLQDVVDREAALDALGELLDDLTALADLGHQDALGSAAVGLTDDDVLADVHHAAGQITGVGGTQSCIGQTFTGAMGGNKVFQYVQTFTEIGLDRQLDGTAGCIGHQTTHTGQLFNLLVGTTGAGVGHHINIVIFIKVGEQGIRNLIIGLLPCLNNGFIAFFFCRKTTAEILCDFLNGLFRIGNELFFSSRHGHI